MVVGDREAGESGLIDQWRQTLRQFHVEAAIETALSGAYNISQFLGWSWGAEDAGVQRRYPVRGP